MSNRVHLQPAFILHYRAYRDTSLIVDFFSEDYGYLSAVAQGARSARSFMKSLLQPFTPLLLSWVGKTELMKLTGVEANGTPYELIGNHLISGLYLNEMLIRVLHKFDPHPQLFAFYQQTLAELQQGQQLQPCLRYFEKRLLTELGYAFSLKTCATTGEKIQTDKFYGFNPSHGIHVLAEAQKTTINVFKGSSLLAFANNALVDQQQLRDAKRLMRIAFAPLLGSKPLKSRELFLVEK